MSRNTTVQRRTATEYGPKSPFKQKLQVNAPNYNKRTGGIPKSVKMTNNAKKSIFNKSSAQDKKYTRDDDAAAFHQDLNENDASLARPEVLSIDSDFGSGNGFIDSPEQEFVSETKSDKNKMFDVDSYHKKDPRLDNVAKERYSYCTPPSKYMVNQSRIPVEKKEGLKEKKCDRRTLHSQKQTNASVPAPVTGGYIQIRQGVYGRAPVNGQSRFQPKTSSHSGSDTDQSSHSSSKGISKHGSNKQQSKAPTSQQASDDMDMKFTDITHMQLKRSLDQIHCQGSRAGSAPASLSGYLYNGVANNAYPHDLNGNAHFAHPVPSTYCGTQQNFHVMPPYAGDSIPSAAPQSSKFDAILRVKDDMLQEKESVILKLRLQIASLQHQVQEGDAALRQVVQSQITSSTNSYNTVNSCKSNASDLQAQKKIYDLEQLLGKAECKLLESSSQSDEEKKSLEKRIEELELSVKSKEQSCTDLKKKQKAATERAEKYKKRVESLERYLGDLPTIQESNKLKLEADMLGVERENLVVEISTLKNKLEEKVKLIKEKETELETKNQTESEHLKEIEKLQDDVAKLEKSKEELGKTERDELEDAKFEISRLQKEKEDAARMLSGCERRLKQQQDRSKEEVLKMEEKVKDAEEMAENIRREMFMKQQASNKVHTAMMNLSSQNQQLMDQKLTLQDRVKTLEKLQSNMAEASRACLRLQRETNGAVQDLKAVSQVLIQTSKGSDPNISALLGVRGGDSTGGEEEGFAQQRSGEAEDQIEAVVSVEQTNKRLLEVRRLRKDVDQLRTMLSNQYADSIGDNCTTQ